ncbi:MAG: hypothetical protein ACI8TL_001255 [Natronomonas sp.]|jgi:hypothetical protein
MPEQTEALVGRVERYVRDAPVVGAIFVGGASYLSGFLLTYLFVILDSGLDAKSTSEAAITETGIFQQAAFSGFPRPEPTTTEFVGWLFYNAHFADTVITPQVAGRGGQAGAETQTAPESINFLSTASTQIPGVVYQLIPVLALTAGGYALARAARIAVSRDIVRVGLGIPTGYVPLALLGTVLFRVSATAEQGGIEVMVTASPSLLGPVAMGLISTLFGITGIYLGAQSERTE